MPYKKFVNVAALIDKNGVIKPLYLIWEDEYGMKTTFKIERVINAHKSKFTLGEECFVYECLIEGHQRILYYEQAKNRWFIEQKGK